MKCKKVKGDHKDRKNYDDLNEFFWTSKCFSYRYSTATDDTDAIVEAGLAGGALPEESVLPPVTEGLLAAPKTFLEKRSWFKGIMALNRLVEWHIVTFYLLAVLAFSRHLVWGWVYSLQVFSGVFWIYNILGLGWELLDVWGDYPAIELSGTSVCGSGLKILFRFVVLIYQTLYLMWTFGPTDGSYFGLEEDSNFWWWQYVWLSLLCMVPYTFEALLNVYPVTTTRLCTSNNDYLQSFLNILYPMSRLYVGKECHESFKHAKDYMVFWITMIAFKLVFSYRFEVSAMVLPTLEITDDYINYHNMSFEKMSLLLVLRWLPQFLVYTIDMSIWYALWQAFAGTSVGLQDNLGSVRDINDIRDNFVRAPEAFCKKMLSDDAGSRKGSSANFNSRDSLNNVTEATKLLDAAESQRLQSYVNNLLDVRIQKWVMFSAAWNEVIDQMRQEDILSNRERDYLLFSRFDGFSQAIYLPVFQTAGVIDEVLAEIERPQEDVPLDTDAELFRPVVEHTTMRTAVSEVWELGSFVLVHLMGHVHNTDIASIMNMVLRWSESGSLCDHVKMAHIRKAMVQFKGLISLLDKSLKRRKPITKGKPKAVAQKSNRASVAVAQSLAKSGGGNIRRAISASSLSAMEVTSDFSRPEQGYTLQRQVHKTVIVDALRDQVREKFRNMISCLKGLLKNSNEDLESRDVLDRITFMLSMENGFMWDDSYASEQLDKLSKDDLVTKVLTKGKSTYPCLLFFLLTRFHNSSSSSQLLLSAFQF